MSRIKRFLRLRRQNDDIKIVTVYVIIAIYCFASSLFTGIEFYKCQSSEASYEFITINTKDIADLIIENNKIIDGTLLKIIPMQFNVLGNQYDMNCRMLSKEYLQNEIGVMNVQKNVFYANSKAVQMMFSKHIDRNIKYTIIDEGGTSKSYWGQVVEIDSGSDKVYGAAGKNMDEVEPMIYCYGTVGELQDSKDCIIKIKNHDLDGTIMMYLSENGFYLKDSKSADEETAILNKTLIRIKYEIIIAIICFVSANTIYKKYIQLNSKK